VIPGGLAARPALPGSAFPPARAAEYASAGGDAGQPCGQWLWNAGRRELAAGPDAERDDLVVAAVEQAPVVNALGSRPSGRASADHGAGRDDADAPATVKICSEGSARRSVSTAKFHVAAELATHADDIGVPVAHDEHGQRTAWRARYSRFALAEAKPQLEIRQAGARTAVTDGPATVELDDDELIEAVMGRLDETSGFSATLRALLSMMP
jgi:hypothetical protein